MKTTINGRIAMPNYIRNRIEGGTVIDGTAKTLLGAQHSRWKSRLVKVFETCGVLRGANTPYGADNIF